MVYRILILGASYGSLLGTKLLMAGHDVTLVCREATARLINDEGTQVRIKLRGEDEHRAIFSKDLPGKLNALTPEQVDPADYDLVGLAMQEPQYKHATLRQLMDKIAKAKVPCLSIMNMPPIPYLKRIEGLDVAGATAASSDATIWNEFDPELVTLCSPDPQAFRPPEEKPNVLHVGLPTNFKAAGFSDAKHNAMLNALAADIDAVRLDGQEVPVKLRVHDSLFVPLAKWSMLLTGNYRCVRAKDPVAIRDAVHADLEQSRSVYAFVDELAQKLGADPADQVPFEKYAKAAEGLLKPSSVARAIDAGAADVERVDKLVQLVARSLGMDNPSVNETVERVDACLAANR